MVGVIAIDMKLLELVSFLLPLHYPYICTPYVVYNILVNIVGLVLVLNSIVIASHGRYPKRVSVLCHLGLLTKNDIIPPISY